jgi:hypothetical protein
LSAVSASRPHCEYRSACSDVETIERLKVIAKDGNWSVFAPFGRFLTLP